MGYSVNVGLVKREYTELSKTTKEFLYKKNLVLRWLGRIVVLHESFEKKAIYSTGKPRLFELELT